MGIFLDSWVGGPTARPQRRRRVKTKKEKKRERKLEFIKIEKGTIRQKQKKGKRRKAQYGPIMRRIAMRLFHGHVV